MRYESLEKVVDFMKNSLKRMGYAVDTKYSSSSKSTYLELKNFTELTGESSDYNGDTLKIRISDHDLPPSYDGLFGYHDMDIYVGKYRPGNAGTAESYDSAIMALADFADKPYPQHIKNIINKENKAKQEDEARKERQQKETDWVESVEISLNNLEQLFVWRKRDAEDLVVEYILDNKDKEAQEKLEYFDEKYSVAENKKKRHKVDQNRSKFLKDYATTYINKKDANY